MKILVIDDHPLWIEGFHVVVGRLRPQWELTTAASGREGLGQIASSQPDLVVIDIFLPDRDGFDLLHSVREERPSLPVLLMSGRDRAAMAVRAAASAATGFLSKKASPTEIVRMIEAAMLQDAVSVAADGSATVPDLTLRQMEVLELLAAGHSNREILGHLGIAERTVRAHLTAIFSILGVSGRLAAVIRARELGLIR